MSSVLHPVGPEPRERYWVRRLAVLVAAIVAIGVVVALVGNAMSAGSAVQAEPAPPTSVPPVAPSTPVTPTPTPGTDSVSPTASPTPGTTNTSSASATPSSSATPSTKDDSSTKKSSSEDSKKKKVVKQPTYSACDASDLRPTLTGEKTVKTKDKTTFTLSLINGSKKTCNVNVSASDATLTVVSGGDRIWSTKDCPKAQPAVKRTLLPEHAVGWKVTWSGKRSGDGCSTGKAAPKKGYYWAIASFDGAADVRFRVILT